MQSAVPAPLTSIDQYTGACSLVNSQDLTDNLACHSKLLEVTSATACPAPDYAAASQPPPTVRGTWCPACQSDGCVSAQESQPINNFVTNSNDIQFCKFTQCNNFKRDFSFFLSLL